jgi:hypothetical protein
VQADVKLRLRGKLISEGLGHLYDAQWATGIWKDRNKIARWIHHPVYTGNRKLRGMGSSIMGVIRSEAVAAGVAAAVAVAAVENEDEELPGTPGAPSGAPDADAGPSGAPDADADPSGALPDPMVVDEEVGLCRIFQMVSNNWCT